MNPGIPDPTRQEASLTLHLPANFGELLRTRREAAGMSIADLAQKAGVVRTTIHNLEAGLTAPSPQTLKRLVAVRALRLSELNPDDESPSDAWFTEAYNPLAMAKSMETVLNGPGGQLDQTYLYLDPLSASDWYTLSNSEQYMTAFRSKLPLDKLADRIVRESKGVGLDVDGLGCGDGKTETALMQRLADRLPTPPDLQLYLLDISHVLLAEAYRTALNTLAPRRIPVVGIHGNFNDVSRNPLLYLHPTSIQRRRVFLMMGATFGNIQDEPWMLRDLAACAEPGDLAVIDFQCVRAPIDQPEQIRALDIPLRNKRPVEAYEDFLTGPLRRHCRGLIGLRLRTELVTHCPVPGSYAVECWADVEKEAESQRRFMLWRIKRYDIDALTQCVRGLGWHTVQAWKYGPDQLAGVLLIQRL